MIEKSKLVKNCDVVVPETILPEPMSGSLRIAMLVIGLAMRRAVST